MDVVDEDVVGKLEDEVVEVSGEGVVLVGVVIGVVVVVLMVDEDVVGLEDVVDGLCDVDSPGLGLSPQSTLSA